MVIEAIGRTNNPNGRPSNADLVARNIALRERNANLVTETRALLDEVGRLGTELLAIRRRIELAFQADRPDVAMHVVGRLDALGNACVRRGGRAA